MKCEMKRGGTAEERVEFSLFRFVQRQEMTSSLALYWVSKLRGLRIGPIRTLMLYSNPFDVLGEGNLI